MFAIDLSELTIISITYNNPAIASTVKSIEPLVIHGVTHVIQNGGAIISDDYFPKSIVFNEKDLGLYDAINKGIQKVATDYFMLIHAGDEFISSADVLQNIISKLKSSRCSIALNSQWIGSRKHSSMYWRPWMLLFGTQPPHMPCIFSSKMYKGKKYNLDIPVIADFDFFLTQVNWKEYTKTNEILVRMETGGMTSNGFRSFFTLNKLFYKIYGLRGLLMIAGRIPLKLFQMI